MKKVLSGLLLSLLSAVALAASKTPPVLESLVSSGGVLVKSFPAAAGLTGWVVKPQQDGPPRIVYTSADGKYLIVGRLIDASGKDLTDQYTSTMVDQPDPAKYWAQVQQSAYVVEGAKNPKAVMYVFMDPNCIYCHLLWKGLQPYEKAGLQVRWIPVGILKPDSVGMAAALLESKDADGLMHQLETKYQESSESGGIAPVDVSPAMGAKLATNLKLMQQMGLFGTPSIVFKDAGSGKVDEIQGLPRLTDIAKITGLPAQAEMDPELARFQ